MIDPTIQTIKCKTDPIWQTNTACLTTSTSDALFAESSLELIV